MFVLFSQPIHMLITSHQKIFYGPVKKSEKV